MLSREDYYKIIKFLEITQSAKPEEYRSLVLTHLANIFNYEMTTFWLADNNGDMVDPITLSLDWRIMNSFREKYYKYDPFYPKNLPKRLLNKNVITINDLGTTEEYKENLFYKDILQQYGLSHKIMYVYRDNGKIIGASTFLRPENYKDFCQKDISLIETCLQFVSKSLSNILLLNNLDFQKFLFESLSNNSNTGFLVLNHNLKIIYSNSAAIEYCQKLSGCDSFENPVQYFVKKFMSNNNLLRYGLTTTLYSDDIKTFSVKIIPHVRHQKNPEYLVFIQPSSITENTEQNKENALIDNLTSREREVFIQVLKGRSNQEIAGDLYISIATVKSHIQSIFDKCNVSNRASLCYKFNTLKI